jgi:hypothetical protein
LPEGVHGYPRWQGTLRSGPAFPTIVAQETRRAFRNIWATYALALVFIVALFYAPRLPSQNTLDNFLAAFHTLLWGGVAMAGIIGASTLLEDSRHNALELYLSRGLRMRDYLAGKVLAVFGLTSLAVIGPALLYFVATVMLVEQHPAHWELVPLGVLVEGLLWAGVLTALALGVSCVSRNARAASITLLGSFFIMDVFVSNLLEGITRNAQLQILSPLVSMAQLSPVLFQAGDQLFPWWWGLAEMLLLLGIGIALVAWKHPRLAGG